MSYDRGPSIVLCELWERESSKGNQYFTGFWGGLSVALLRDGERPHPTRPDETIVVWKLVAQERQPRAAAGTRDAVPSPAAKPPERVSAPSAGTAPTAPETPAKPIARPDGRQPRPDAPQRRQRPYARESQAAYRRRVAAEIGGDRDPNDPLPF